MLRLAVRPSQGTLSRPYGPPSRRRRNSNKRVSRRKVARPRTAPGRHRRKARARSDQQARHRLFAPALGQRRDVGPVQQVRQRGSVGRSHCGRRGRSLWCAERRGAVGTSPRLCSRFSSRCSSAQKPRSALQRLGKMLDRQVPIARPILLHDEFDLVHRHPPSRYRSNASTHRAICTSGRIRIPRFGTLHKPDRSSAIKSGHRICY